jgi:hypothetical protein
MHDRMYENQSRLSMPFLLALAAYLELSQGPLVTALDTGEYTFTQRLRWWCAKRRQWYADLLHKRPSARWAIRFRSP